MKAKDVMKIFSCRRALMVIMLLFTYFTTTEAKITIQLFSTYPSQQYVFTAWGHSAIRVLDDEQETDIVYNYGVFSFDDVFKFVVDFVKGDTDYQLEARSHKFDEAIERTMRKRGVPLRVQTLDLTQDEALRLKSALEENAYDANWRYRYNFFYDNCATRPRLMLENSIGAKIEYNAVQDTVLINKEKISYRDIIHNLLDESKWYAFGIDICLGSPTDDIPNDSLMMFLPLCLADGFADAKIVENYGTDSVSARSLVSNDDVFQPLVLQETESGLMPSPLVLFWIFFVLVVVHTIFYYRIDRDDYIWFDSVLYFLFALLGLLVFFLMFISTHPCVYPNYNLLWLHPLLFLFPLFIIIRPLRQFLRWLYLIDSILVSIAIVCFLIGLQTWNYAFIPLLLVRLVRARSFLLRYT